MFVLIIARIYYPRVDDMLYLLGNFFGCFAGMGWVCYSPFRHTFTFVYHECDSIPEFEKA